MTKQQYQNVITELEIQRKKELDLRDKFIRQFTEAVIYKAKAISISYSFIDKHLREAELNNVLDWFNPEISTRELKLSIEREILNRKIKAPLDN